MPRTKSSKLTKRQREVLMMIRDWTTEAGFPPTRRDIAEHFDFKSPNASEEHLKALERKGVITVLRNTSRGIVLAPEFRETGGPADIPVIGRVAAGSPVLAQEHIERHVKIPETLFHPKAEYFLKVQGDSMINAGILDGDLLAVHKTTEVRNGQIVVARLDNEVTVKRFERLSEGDIALIPENKNYAPIRVENDSSFAIEGISVGLVREH